MPAERGEYRAFNVGLRDDPEFQATHPLTKLVYTYLVLNLGRTGLGTPVSSRKFTYIPGNKRRSGFGTTARNASAPVVGFTLKSEKSSVPSCGYGVPS